MNYEVISKISSTLVQLTVNFFYQIKQTATKLKDLKKRKEEFKQFWVNSTSCFLQLCKISMFLPIFLPYLHPNCFWCWTIPNHMLKKYTLYIDAKLAGHANKPDVKLPSLCGSGFFVCCVRACQALPLWSALPNNTLWQQRWGAFLYP